MYSNKLNLKFLKFLFSEKNAVLDQINIEKKIKTSMGFEHATCRSEVHELTDWVTRQSYRI
jgi:hypothetical protein